MSTFLISDTHFGHAGVTQFLNNDGTKMRPWDNVEEMDEALVKNWNSVVRPKDKVYHLGDVVINRKALKTLARLNGEKVLIKGNHDIFRPEEYLKYFKDLLAYHPFDEFVFAHIPMHADSLSRWKGQIHGHLHSYRVKKEVIDNSWYGMSVQIDPLYLSVCVEQINYTPIAWEDVKKRFKEQQ